MSKGSYQYQIFHRTPSKVYSSGELHGDPNLQTLLGFYDPAPQLPSVPLFEFPEPGRLRLGPTLGFFSFNLSYNSDFNGFEEGVTYSIKAEGSGLLGAIVRDQESRFSPVTSRLIGIWGDTTEQEEEYWANNSAGYLGQSEPPTKLSTGYYNFVRGTASSATNVLTLANLDDVEWSEFNSLSFQAIFADRPGSTLQDKLD